MIAVTFGSEETDGDEEGDDEGAQSSLTISGNRDKDVIDLSDLPEFTPPKQTFAEAATMVTVDAGILALSILIVFMGALVRFLRYDVR